MTTLSSSSSSSNNNNNKQQQQGMYGAQIGLWRRPKRLKFQYSLIWLKNQFFSRFDCYDFSQKNIGRFMIFWIERLLRRMTFKGSIQTRTRFGACFSMWIPTKPLAQITLHHEYLRHVLNSLLTFFCIIFNACFSTNTVPTTWKTACIVPTPKRPVISSTNDLCPVALTSAVMKVCERVVL